jgi:hypothetical protein
MDAANRACQLPNLKHELSKKNQLYNDQIQWLKSPSVGFLSSNKDSLGVNFVNSLCDALWYVDGNHLTQANRGCAIPTALLQFQGYYKPELRKRKKV